MVYIEGSVLKTQDRYESDQCHHEYLYSVDPLKPHLYTCIVKLGFIGVYIIFLISAQNIDCGTR